MQRSKFKLLSLFTVAGLAAFLLTGCGTSNAEPANLETDTLSDTTIADSEEVDDGTTSNSDTGGEAEISYGDTTYSAKLQFCSFSGGEDALFHGVAHDDSGEEVGYLDGDFGGLNDAPYGEVRINFGASAQFQSADDFIAMGDAASHIVVTDFSDTGLIIMGGAWDQDGAQLPTATLKVTC